MSAYNMPSISYYAKTVSKIESLDELWADEDFLDDLVDAINQNFVLEVEARHAPDE